jgi:hypothetical protein
MDKVQIAKRAINVVVGAGVTRIVAGIIANNTNPDKVTDKVAIAGASFVLGSMAAEATTGYTDARIDSIVTWWRENYKKEEVESSEL